MGGFHRHRADGVCDRVAILVYEWDCTGSPNQAWALTAPDTTPASVIAKSSGKCLDVTGGPGATQNGALIEQWSCTGAANRQWSQRDAGGGQMELIAQHSGKCIEVVNGGTTNGTHLQQEPCTGASAQLWTRQDTGMEGEYTLLHVPSSRCLDISGGPGALANGALLELWDCTSAANQTWLLGLPGSPTAGTRDPLNWPFAQNSIWNMPIGNGAIYVPAGIPAIPNYPSSGVTDDWVPMPGLDYDRIVLTPTAPVTSIAYSSAGWSGSNRCAATGGSVNGLPVSVPIPTTYAIPAAGQQNTHPNAALRTLHSRGTGYELGPSDE